MVMFNSPWPLDPGESMTFTVSVQEDGSAAPGKTVTFSVSPDDGTVSLSTTSATTDSDGQAQTILRTGSGSSGSYTVTASVGDSSLSSTATVETAPPPPPPELSISVISGPGSGAPGDTLTFTVEVQENGSTASGQTVTFSITSGDGNASLNPTSTTTGSNGRAQTTLTLGGSASGSYTVKASVGDISVSGTATVETSPPPPPSEYYLWVISFLGSGAPGDTLTYIVEVRGEDESPAPGQTVTFSITSGDGNASLNPTSATTGSNGQASTTLTLGSSASGSYTVKASISNHLFVNSIATVQTSPPPLPELSISVVSGPGSGEPGDTLPFTVEVQEDGSPASGKTVTFSITSGDGNASLGTASTTTGSDGRASTTLILGNSASGSYTITASSGSKSTSGTATVDTPPPPPPELSISVVSGPGSGEPGDTLTFVVEVQEDGSPAPGKTVTFSITSGDGNASLGTASTTTGSDGRASTTLILGNSASGSYTITASSGSKSTSGTATVDIPPPPPPELFLLMISSPWPLDPGESMTFTVSVQEDGSAAPGKTVTFSVSPDDGTVSLSTTSATTDSGGRAQTILRTGSGSSGSYTVTASVGDSSLSSTAIVETSPPPGLSISVISGPGSGAPGDTLTFIVEVQEDGSAAPGKTVTFSITSGDGNASLGTTSTTTGNNGRAQTTLTLGGSASSSYTITASSGSKSTSGTATVDTPPPLPELSISVISGPGSGAPGDTLTFIVEVQEDGSAAPGKTVTFSITSGDGNASLGTTSTTTGNNGRAQTTLTLGGSASGSYTITASSGSKSTSGTATVDTPPPPPPELFLLMISSPWPLDPGESMTFTVSVQEDGSTAPGKTVTFSVSPDDGTVSLSTTSATTDSGGRAQTILRTGSGSSGSYTVTASVGDSSVSGTATVETSSPPPGLSISVISGPGSGAPGDTLTFTVEVQENGSAASGKTVTFSITSGDGNASLSPTSATTGSNGRAQTTLTLGSNASGSYTVKASVGDIFVSGTATVEAPPPPPPELFLLMISSPWPLDPSESMTFTVWGQEDGSAAPGKTVTFSVSPDDGTVSLSTTSATTDSDGRAQAILRTGSGSSGSYTVTASVGDSSVSGTATVETSPPPPPPPPPQQQQPATTLPPLPEPTTLLSISGDNQEGVTGEVLANPFVVEVRDENGDPLEGVAVRFVVLTGGGSLSATTSTTDPNGRVESTLTLGSDPGANTVEVSVEGISQMVVFNAVAESLAFDLSVPSGISFIHVPLKVRAVDGTAQALESVADLYDALGGTDTVNLLITYDPNTQGWHSYLGDSRRGTVADKVLTDDTGIIADMKAPVSVRMSGDALGADGRSIITLNRGINLVGLPLRDSRIARVSDLSALEGIADNVSVIIVLDNGTFKVVGRAGDDGDIPVTGGQAFTLTAREAATVALSGDRWDNTSSNTMAAPPLATGGIQVAGITPVLALSGSLFDEVRHFNSAGFRVIVKNLSTGNAVAGVVGDTDGTPSQLGYQLTVVDMEMGRAAAIGDILEISVISSDASIGVQPLRYTVTTEDVRRSRVQLPALIVQKILAETALLPNYPNPFNPETWIPYQLRTPAEVRVSIYNQRGVPVREISLGHQTAGQYISRTRAAYWDGRNEVGELVASGIYFYTLTAADFTATRKMVIGK